MALPAALVPLASKTATALREAAPSIAARAAEYYNKATGGKVATVDAAAAYGATSKQALALVLKGAVKSGVNPSALFTDEVNDAQMQSLMAELRTQWGQIQGTISKSEDLLSGNPDALIAGAVATLQSYIPSLAGEASVTRFHAALRTFAATSDAQLSHCFFQARQLRRVGLG